MKDEKVRDKLLHFVILPSSFLFFLRGAVQAGERLQAGHTAELLVHMSRT